MTHPSHEDQVRQAVSTAYADAIQNKQPSCCAPTCCDSSTDTATAAGKVGYTGEQLAAVPEDVADSSFGCGSPLAFAEVQEGQTVVDLGSGAGLDLILAAKAVGPTGKVIGVDMTDAMLERARANVAKAGVTNVELRKGIIESMPVDAASVDWVISNCVINLSPEKPKVFAEIARVLAPGGRVRVSDIVADDLPDWIQAHSGLFTACVAGAISEADYVAGLREAGLVDVEIAARLPYDAAQIRAFAESEELPAELTPDMIEAVAEALAGKIASVKVVARKPG